jgi:hypothetical protein
MKPPAPINHNMYFAIETFSVFPGLEQTVRLKEHICVTHKGAERFTLCEHPEYWGV